MTRREASLEGSEDAKFRSDLLALIPRLRGFARALGGSQSTGDDLAQEAMLRAWRGRGGFETGSNMEAWLFRILRNAHISGVRANARRPVCASTDVEETVASADDPSSRLALNDLRRALNRLPAPQREALMLIGAAGWSYEEAARHAGCPIGTLKTRVFRARRSLAEHLSDGVILRDAIHPADAAEGLMRQVTEAEAATCQ